MKHFIIKLAAWIVFSLFILLSLGILSIVFFLFIWLKDVNMVKMIILDLVIILISVGTFVLGLGILEFVLSFIKVEKDLEEIEEVIPEIEEEIDSISSATHHKNDNQNKGKKTV